MKRRRNRVWLLAVAGILAGFLLGLWVGYQFIPGLSNASISELSAEQQDEFVKLVALGYAQTQDVGQAERQLASLEAPNSGQFVASVTERTIAGGGDARTIGALAQLAVALGVQNATLTAYLLTATPLPTPTLVPPTPTMESWPTATAADPTPTSEPPTSTPEPETSTPTPEPSTATPESGPAVIADSPINVRGGPGTGFAVVGSLTGGERAPILGRTNDSSWWQIELADGTEGWVLAEIVSTSGNTDGIAIAANIPTPPPAPTTAPRPTAAPTNPPAPAGPAFRLVERRLWTVEETGGHLAGTSVNCGEKHELQIKILDASGAPLNGVTIGSIYNNEEHVSGEKGPGMAEFILYPPGNGVRVKRDVNGSDASSDSAEAPTDPRAISYGELIGARFCQNDADCARFVSLPGCYGHYTWSATFQRNY
ncbi:MAG: SH3 domain-containing protein [Caldilineales bacterium]|nr:SH3 domain-containing protein [Caldilineales bacterium]